MVLVNKILSNPTKTGKPEKWSLQWFVSVVPAIFLTNPHIVHELCTMWHYNYLCSLKVKRRQMT